jgi:hypothetical protein
MYVADAAAPSESGTSVLVTDKRRKRLKPSRREGEWLPVSELGSKAVYQVHAEGFTPVALDL